MVADASRKHASLGSLGRIVRHSHGGEDTVAGSIALTLSEWDHSSSGVVQDARCASSPPYVAAPHRITELGRSSPSRAIPSFEFSEMIVMRCMLALATRTCGSAQLARPWADEAISDESMRRASRCALSLPLAVQPSVNLALAISFICRMCPPWFATHLPHSPFRIRASLGATRPCAILSAVHTRDAVLSNAVGRIPDHPLRSQMLSHVQGQERSRMAAASRSCSHGRSVHSRPR